MAAVEVTITGMLYDRLNRTSQNVVLIGEAHLTGLGVGGGPMPPGPGKPPGSPPGIWGGPIDPHPDHGLPSRPGIWPGPGDPDFPGGKPPGGEKPPEPIEPPVKWKAVWHPVEGWVVVGVINPDVPHPVPST